jgi:hypothetical protein
MTEKGNILRNNQAKYELSLRLLESIKGQVLNKIEALEQFRYFALQSIEIEKKAFQNRFRKSTKGMTEREISNLLDIMSEDSFLIDSVFQNIYTYSFVIILYSYIENGLNTICWAEYHAKLKAHILMGGQEIKIQYNDVPGKGIERAKKYLKEEIKKNIYTDGESWTEIKSLQKIRDSIVHNGGLSNEKIEGDSNIKRHVKENRIEIINTTGRINIKPDYLEYIFERTKEFFQNAISTKQK